MNKRLLRFLWLDDERLKRNGRQFGYISIGLSIIFLIGGIFITVIASTWAEGIEDSTRNIAESLRQIQLHDESDRKTIDIVSELILYFGKSFQRLLFPTALILISLFLMTVHQGIMYLRMSEILSKDSR